MSKMYSIRTLSGDEFPPLLQEIPQPPEKLYLAGTLPPHHATCLSVVGSRKYTSYGKEACEHIIGGLRGSGVVIVSGLALGIDSIAHKAALEAGLTTIAIPGSGLDPSVLYPRTNVTLAEEIIKKGGGLLSEFEPAFNATQYAFPQRNRLMAGLSRGVFVIEAGEKSGTLITARLALEYNRDVFVVPGSIFSRNSIGSNSLLRQGAIPVTSAGDILEQWGMDTRIKNQELGIMNDDILKECSEKELKLIEFLYEPLTKDELIQKMNIPIHEINILLSTLEIKGMIKENTGKIRLHVR